MTNQELSISLALILATMLFASTAAQDCTNVLISMSPCLNYISGNSSTPSSGCCTQLSSVVRSQPQCLCQVLNGGGSNLGLNINQTQALALPRACNVETPPVSQCNAASPSGSPGSTPTSPNTNSGAASTQSGTVKPIDQGSNLFGQCSPNQNGKIGNIRGGSKTVPSSGDGSSDATSNKLAVSVLFGLLFVASYISTFNMA